MLGVAVDVSNVPAVGAGNQHRVHLHGELDLAAEQRLLEEIGGLLDAPGSSVLLDCSGVTFADSSGIRALVRLRRDHGDRLTVAALSPSLRRVLEISGLLPLFLSEDGAPGCAGHG